jgi:hypothetical protein
MVAGIEKMTPSRPIATLWSGSGSSSDWKSNYFAKISQFSRGFIAQSETELIPNRLCCAKSDKSAGDYNDKAFTRTLNRHV